MELLTLVPRATHRLGAIVTYVSSYLMQLSYLTLVSAARTLRILQVNCNIS